MRKKAAPGPHWPDGELVAQCLAGSERAWGALVDKYKNLVYSIILKYGHRPEEAADLFQAVWLDIHHDLEKLRKPDSVKPWLISLVRNKCFHWKQKTQRRRLMEVEGEEAETLESLAIEEPDFVAELEQDQLIREALAGLPERCRELVNLLFFADPPLPYKEAAERLGLATGSIGFIRGRCLKKLQKELEQLGFE